METLYIEVCIERLKFVASKSDLQLISLAEKQVQEIKEAAKLLDKGVFCPQGGLHIFSHPTNHPDIDICEKCGTRRYTLALPDGHSGSSLECIHPFCVAEREKQGH